MLTSSKDVPGEVVRALDGLGLQVRSWPVARPRGLVVVAHGLGEHAGAYSHLAEAIGARLNLDFHALDFRGHGRSPGRRGVVRRYDDLVGDLRAVIAWARARNPHLPLFVLGHSNGGQVVLRLALEPPAGIQGLIVSNPSIKIAMPVPPTKLKIGKVLLVLAPWITLKSDAPATWMTRDPAVQATYHSDRLRHNRISAPLFFGMVEGGAMLMERAAAIRLPTLMLIGGQDPVISPGSSREFFDRLGAEDKTLLLYPRMLHEPFNELGRELVFEDLARWLESRLG